MAEFELAPYVRPVERYASVGGISAVLRDLREVVEFPLTHPEIYKALGVEPPRGVLLHGPPGCGKTLLGRAVAGELGCHFRYIAGPEIVGGVSGESESRLRMLFDDAVRHAPSIVFLDEVDAIAPRRDATARGMERRIVSQLFACMDGLALDRTNGLPVLVLAATSRPDGVDPGLRRAGRFDREIAVPIPDERARRDILRLLTTRMKLAPVDPPPPSPTAATTVAAAGDDAAASQPPTAAAAAPVAATAAPVAAAAAAPAAAAAAAAAASAAVPGPAALDLVAIARATPGFVGADLVALTKEAAVAAVNRAFSLLVPTAEAEEAEEAASDGVHLRHVPELTPAQLAPLYVQQDDFLAAMKKVQPTGMREGFATIPNVTWGDVGALTAVREELNMSIVAPLRLPELFKAFHLQAPAGVLLYGPPGCGKTLLAKAVANQTNANFISVKGPELLDKYVGESERAVRAVFTRAAASAPCIVFFDELDALAPRRGGGGGSAASGGVSERVVNQLLTELDGLDARRNVFVLAATNRPDIIDPAMLRPGRLDKLLYVPLPSPAERAAILRTHTRRTPLAADVDLAAIAARPACTGFSGADLAGLVREATTAALKEFLAARDAEAAAAVAAGLPPPPMAVADGAVAARHFDAALAITMPSVSAVDERQYNTMAGRLRRARSHVTAEAGSGAAAPPAGAPPAS